MAARSDDKLHWLSLSNTPFTSGGFVWSAFFIGGGGGISWRFKKKYKEQKDNKE